MVFSVPHQFLAVALGEYSPSLCYSLLTFQIGGRQQHVIEEFRIISCYYSRQRSEQPCSSNIPGDRWSFCVSYTSKEECGLQPRPEALIKPSAAAAQGSRWVCGRNGGKGEEVEEVPGLPPAGRRKTGVGHQRVGRPASRPQGQVAFVGTGQTQSGQ